MPISKFKDVPCEGLGGAATLTLSRPDQLDAGRVGIYEEVTAAILHAGWHKDTHAGGQAF